MKVLTSCVNFRAKYYDEFMDLVCEGMCGKTGASKADVARSTTVHKIKVIGHSS